MGPIARLLDRPVAEWTDSDRLGRLAVAAARWQARWTPPTSGVSLQDVLPAPVSAGVQGIAARVWLPDRDLLERALDHDLVDRLVVDFITRLLMSFAHHEEDDRARSSLLPSSIGRLTEGLESAMTSRIAEYAESHRHLVARYLADVLTDAEELPEFARWRAHVVDAAWTTPLKRLFPVADAVHAPPVDLSDMRAGWKRVLDRLGDQTPLELLVAMGFEEEATRELARALDGVLEPDA